MDNTENLSFGKRFGLEPIDVPFQTDGLNKKTRIDLWNAHYLFIQKTIEDAEYYERDNLRTINKLIWIHFFSKAYNDFPSHDFQFGDYIRDYIEKSLWYKVYELFEFIFLNIKGTKFDNNDYKRFISSKLKENNCGYTISNNRFIPVINATEVQEIEKAQQLSKKFKLSGIQEHLNASIELISKKPNPDYRNSIKESISMVEVISRIIEPSENTLGKALNKLDKNQKINNTLKLGFEKLYAYTNDKNGIRHALMDEQTIDIEDARFFLISCSAFTNYLIEKAIKENLLK